jgi:hypothetical protein
MRAKYGVLTAEHYGILREEFQFGFHDCKKYATLFHISAFLFKACAEEMPETSN